MMGWVFLVDNFTLISNTSFRNSRCTTL